MNLNITVEDLQLGRYETQKNVLLRRFAEKRAILSRLGQEGHPPIYLESELLQHLRKARLVSAHIEESVGTSNHRRRNHRHRRRNHRRHHNLLRHHRLLLHRPRR